MFVFSTFSSFSNSNAMIGSLSLLLILGFGGGLGRLPPGAVVRVPLDGLLQALLEVRVRRLPAELGPQLGGVDRVAAVVAGTVLHPVERVRVLAHHGQDVAQHGDVVAFPVRADQVGLAQTALGQDGPHAGGVVVRMDPVAHVLAIAVQLRAKTLEDIRDLARDELLHMLEGTVVVRAVRDRGADAVRARPRAHQHVRRRLRGRIRAGRMVWGMLRELRRIVQGEVAVHLVRAHVVVAHVVLAGRLQEAERALHVGLQERFRICDGIVVVRLGRVMHDRVMPRHDFVEQVRVADVAHHELHTVLGQARDVLRIARVRELVQNGDMHVRMVVHHVMHEIRSDETAATGHNNVLGSKRLFSHICNISRLRVRVFLKNVKIGLDIQSLVSCGEPAGRLCKYG